MINSKHLASTGKTALNLIRNQDNAVLITELSQSLQELLWWNNETTFALNWFNDHRCNTFWSHFRDKETLEVR